ncbi:MAG: uracil-DNA glycosylase [Candidatus Taylorbacteria bacterium]|nr:uracil-DNA glycosylase [Candidatus Taylorbacteria bacterium]
MSKTKLMKKIHNEVMNLKKSPLYAERVKNKMYPVIGEGSNNAQIMFVGEAPGRNEAKTGKPFCGAAGKVLDALLKSVSILREEIYITNIVKDRPPFNRDPLPKEIEVYGPFLDRQIEIIKPKVIATLGRYAMNYVMKKFDLELQLEPIGKAHGKAYRTKASYGNIDIVALYHPCVAVYNPNNLYNLKKDFKILNKYKM